MVDKILVSFSDIKRLYIKSELNSNQFLSMTKDAVKTVDAENKKSKIPSSSDNDKIKVPKQSSEYNKFIAVWMSKHKGNPHEVMKAGANHWTNGGGKEQWEQNTYCKNEAMRYR